MKKIQINKMRGSGVKKPSTSEQKNLLTNRVSIISLFDIKKGEKINGENIDIRRPGTGLEPFDYEKILGKIAKKDIPKETPITWELVEF